MIANRSAQASEGLPRLSPIWSLNITLVEMSLVTKNKRDMPKYQGSVRPAGIYTWYAICFLVPGLILDDFIHIIQGYLAGSAMEHRKLSRTDIASTAKKHRSHISFQTIYIGSYFMQYKIRKIWF